MLPTREEALKLIRDGLLFNPGPWGKHCLTAAHCAEKIASACGDMDVEKAYILGLLHDIGRKFGVRYLGHVSDRYTYMKSFWSMKKRYSLPVFPQRKSSENSSLQNCRKI